MIVEFTIPGPPTPKERARKGKGGHWYTPPRTRSYMEHVRWRANHAAPKGWPLDGQTRYRVELQLYFPDRRRRDGDNVLKGVVDACNAVLWRDDSQVVDKRVTKNVDKKNPRAEVTVEVVK